MMLIVLRAMPNSYCGSGSGIRCLSDPWIRDPGWVKNQDPDHKKKTFFGLKYLNSFDLDPGCGMKKIRIRDPASGMETSRIRDKHPG
jgi:hypothetical protein